MQILEIGLPYPLGSKVLQEKTSSDKKITGINFAIFSAFAKKIELCVFDEQNNETRFTLPAKTNAIWHGFLPLLILENIILKKSLKKSLKKTEGEKTEEKFIKVRYAYRVHGEYAPKQGFLFDPNILLIDPYSHELDSSSESIKSIISIYFSESESSIVFEPKCMPIAQPIPWGETIIYEAHVRGLTQCHPDIPKAIQGSYAALAHEAMISHFQKLGITSLELLPIQMHLDEPRLQQLKLENYWGYNVIAPFAIDPKYWSGRPDTTPLSEFKEAVSNLHMAGIEVILDVVFNHTAELDQNGPRISLRGIDNKSYYWIDNQGVDYNFTGCGNTLNCSHPHVIQMIADCLRYWITECCIDGFRFDLGATLGRTNIEEKIATFSPFAPLFVVLQQDPLISKTKLIFEPWDIGPNGYQLGNFPPPYAEWNDQFRDTIRRFWLKQDINFGEFAMRFAGSSDHFEASSRAPNASINMITAHDGFTLKDLVSYNIKHNYANGENNQDGSSDNYSNNHGCEGMSDDIAIQKARYTAQRNLLSCLLLSLGTPMLLAGDEMGHTQQGNNNAYCQNNNTTWIDWKSADLDLYKFTCNLIQVRKQISALIENKWWHSKKAPECQPNFHYDYNHENSYAPNYENNVKNDNQNNDKKNNDKNVESVNLNQCLQLKTDVMWLNELSEPMSPEDFNAYPANCMQILLSETILIVISLNNQCDFTKLPFGDWYILNNLSSQDLSNNNSLHCSNLAQSSLKNAKSIKNLENIPQFNMSLNVLPNSIYILAKH